MDRLPTELVHIISSLLPPHGQTNLALTCRPLFYKLYPQIQGHKDLADECWARLTDDTSVSTLLSICYLNPNLLPYIETFKCDPTRAWANHEVNNLADEIVTWCNISEHDILGEHFIYHSNDPRMPGIQIRDFLRDHPEMWEIIDKIRRGQPAEILAYLLPHLVYIRTLEIIITDGISDFLPAMLIATPFQQLANLTIHGQGEFLSVHCSWIHMALQIPTLRSLHGHLIGGSFRRQEWKVPSPPRSQGSSNLERLILTKSAVKAWKLRIEDLPLKTFLYNYAELFEDVNGHNPMDIVERLPKSIENLAIVENEVKWQRKRFSEKTDMPGHFVDIEVVSFSSLSNMKELWCFWSILVPFRARDENFDLSLVLPQSLEKLVLFGVPTYEVEILLESLPRLPNLQRIWVQVHNNCTSAGDHELPENRAKAATFVQRIQNEAKRLGILWHEPGIDSPFEPYVKHLEVHDWDEFPRGCYGRLGRPLKSYFIC